MFNLTFFKEFSNWSPLTFKLITYQEKKNTTLRVVCAFLKAS